MVFAAGGALWAHRRGGPAVELAATGPIEQIVGLGAAAIVATRDALWRSDGTREGTRKIADGRASLAGAGARAYAIFTTPAGASVATVTPDGEISEVSAELPGSVSQSAVAGGRLFAVSDGGLFTVRGGEVVHLADAVGSGPLAVLGSSVVRASDAGGHAYLIVSDGTTWGTRRIALDGVEELGSLTSAAGVGFFVATTAAEGAVPWTFDGVTARLLLDIAPGPLHLRLPR